MKIQNFEERERENGTWQLPSEQAVEVMTKTSSRINKKWYPFLVALHRLIRFSPKHVNMVLPTGGRFRATERKE